MRYKATLITEYMEKHRFVRTSMIIREFFDNHRVGQYYLARMTEKGLLQRKKIDRGEFVYFLEWSKKWHHWLTINTFHYQLKDELSAWQKITHYEYEVPYGQGIADAFYIVKTTLDGKGKKFFLEVDDDSLNPWEKTQQYEFAYRGEWQGEWWADPLQKGKISFPLIVVYTVRPRVIKPSEIVNLRVISMGDPVKQAIA